MSQQEVVYYESIKRELKIKPIYECRYDERLQFYKLKLRDLREDDSPLFFFPFPGRTSTVDEIPDSGPTESQKDRDGSIEH